VTTATRRLENAQRLLTGREQAILFLRAYKDGGAQDASPRGLRDVEASEFERLVKLIRFANGELADVILILSEQVTGHELRFEWLQTTHRHLDDLWIISRWISACVPHAVAQTKPNTTCYEYVVRDASERKLLREARALVEEWSPRGSAWNFRSARLRLTQSPSDHLWSWQPLPTAWRMRSHRCGAR
jgi:hypothetical protein